jgi:glycosyltransferase involved in cell wall biosynthesis
MAFENPGSSYSPSHIDTENPTPLRKLYSRYLGSYRAAQFGTELATTMSGKGLDIVIERETAFGAGAVLSSILGIPMVLEMIGPRVSPLSLKTARKVLAYSTVMVGGRVPAEKLEIVPAGVDTRIFVPDPKAGAEVRRRHGLEDDVVVGYVGTFQRWHGVNGLLSACARLRRGDRRIKVLLVGPYFADAMKFGKEIGLDGDAIFTGPVSYEAVPHYINACDILCAPYDPSLSTIRSESGIGAPLKVLEYMACAKPIVSTSVPPITKVVENGRTGVLVPPGDIASLASALGDLVDARQHRESLGRSAREAVVARYSWDALTETLEHVLIEAKATGRRGRGNRI